MTAMMTPMDHARETLKEETYYAQEDLHRQLERLAVEMERLVWRIKDESIKDEFTAREAVQLAHSRQWWDIQESLTRLQQTELIAEYAKRWRQE